VSHDRCRREGICKQSVSIYYNEPFITSLNQRGERKEKISL
jgi:hypothetical protein